MVANDAALLELHDSHPVDRGAVFFTERVRTKDPGNDDISCAIGTNSISVSIPPQWIVAPYVPPDLMVAHRPFAYITCPLGCDGKPVFDKTDRFEHQCTIGRRVYAFGKAEGHWQVLPHHHVMSWDAYKVGQARLIEIECATIYTRARLELSISGAMRVTWTYAHMQVYHGPLCAIE